MAKKQPKKKEEKKARAPKAGLENAILKLEDKLALESDRGCVLVAHAAMDDAILRLLGTYFEVVKYPTDVSDESFFLLEKRPVPPLGSFGIRIKLCYLLDIIGKNVLDTLDRFTVVRNAFAHPSQPMEIVESDIPRFFQFMGGEHGTEFFDRKKREFDLHLQASDSRQFSNARYTFMIHAGMLYDMLIQLEEHLRTRLHGLSRYPSGCTPTYRPRVEKPQQ